ncbi:MAG TPA: DotI/IcmL family type IV secretion protein [Alphaproteobacteria bacterium]|nr:DotI/IcmL family type IV secretion protein [Alphaproteobacteria bacterium]
MTIIRPFLFLFIFAGFVFSAQPSEAKSFWEVLFGDKQEDQGPRPEQTLQAPFIDPNAKPTSKMMDIYEQGGKHDGPNTLSLDQPHRSPEAIAQWASGIVDQAMSFSPDGLPTLQKTLAADFSSYGMQEYQAYLQKAGIVQTLTTNNLKILSISDGSAQVLREGVVSGSYHWLVQVPIMATFYDQKLAKINDKYAKNGQNQDIIIQVQIGRTTKKDANTLGIEVERWIVVNQ